MERLRHNDKKDASGLAWLARWGGQTLTLRCVPHRLEYAVDVSRDKKPFLACLPERHVRPAGCTKKRGPQAPSCHILPVTT